MNFEYCVHLNRYGEKTTTKQTKNSKTKKQNKTKQNHSSKLALSVIPRSCVEGLPTILDVCFGLIWWQTDK